MSTTTPPNVPAPRGAAEARAPMSTAQPVRRRAGWVTAVTMLDRQVAALVARLEHDLTRADTDRRSTLLRQLRAARRVEAVTAAAVAHAEHTRSPG